MKTPRFFLRGFSRPHDVATQVLGKLERQVLNEIWCRDEVSVRDVYLAFEERMAYTTLMTNLDRLRKPSTKLHEKVTTPRATSGSVLIVLSVVLRTLVVTVICSYGT
jgi:hypothetical protein